jgi:hypothetical protein
MPPAQRKRRVTRWASRLTQETPPATLRRMKKAAPGPWRIAFAAPFLLALVACGLDLQPHPAPTAIPTRTPLVRLGPDSLQVLHSVPWGTLRLDGLSIATLDGALLPRVPDEVVPTFTLRAGQHTLEYTADPFPSLRCQISQPASASDTCPLFDPPPKYPLQNQNGSRILDVGATLDRLPASQLAALEQAMQARMTVGLGTASATVAQGERYLGADGHVATAPQTWNATPRYTLNTDTNDDGPWAGQPCVTLCETYPGAVIDTTLWTIVAHVIVTWRYTQTNGTVALDLAPAATPERHQHIRQPFAVRWTGAWEVITAPASARIPTPLCAVATSLLAEQLLRSTATQELANYAWDGVSAPNTADGCLLKGGPSTGANSPTANVLYRFGLLYAANDTAHRLLPGLPLADALGQALADMIAALPH